MITLSVRGLPRSTTEENLNKLFAEYGVVRSLKMAKDMFSGECRGFATIQMEGHEARAAIDGLNNQDYNGSHLRVDLDKPRGKPGKRRR